MTADVPGFDIEPSTSDVLAAIRDLAAGQQALAEAMTASFAHLSTELSGVKADVADVKAEIRAAEAGLISRIDSVQQVVRGLKADVARLDDGGHPHAA